MNSKCLSSIPSQLTKNINRQQNKLILREEDGPELPAALLDADDKVDSITNKKVSPDSKTGRESDVSRVRPSASED
jgi:hypothetical protein